MSRNHLLTLALATAILLPSSARAAAATDPTAPVTIGVEAESFQFLGDWITNSYKNERILFSGASGSSTYPAATAVQIPRAGRYKLWVRAIDFPAQNPGTRTCSATVAGTPSPEKFGDSGQSEWTWEPGGTFDLKQGPTLLTLAHAAPYTRIDALLLTTDLSFTPTRPLGNGDIPAAEPLRLPTGAETNPLSAPPVTDSPDDATPVASLSNDHVKIDFLPATRGTQPTLRPRISVKTPAGAWAEAPLDASAEAYTVVAVPPDSKLEYAGFYPRWKGTASPLTVTAGGATVKTLRDGGSDAVWGAGKLTRFLPTSATRTSDNTVTLSFPPSPVGTLSATWSLHPGERAARVTLTFTPKSAGQYSLGYHFPAARTLDQTPELLLPFMFHRHRLPSHPDTLLDPFTPTPVSLMQSAGDHPFSLALVADPSLIPFVWANQDNPHVGLTIRSPEGLVQPAIYAPIPGTAAAHLKPGQPVTLPFRLIAQPGDWYAGFRTAADEVFALRDYRQNTTTSLTDAALNMIDLFMDDRAGGWWPRAKAFYQIESKNTATQASPLLALSLYRLTGNDPDVYRRRALPTVEFLLSRSGAHFSPVPDDAGWYPVSDMSGPVKLFGTTTFAGFYDFSDHLMPAFRDIALPPHAVRDTAGYSHAQPFEEWLARYQLTNDKSDLDTAVRLADEYIAKHVKTPPSDELGPEPFFFMQFVPDWEGLLRMYEVTGEKRFLDASAFGARQLMTGIWTQPLFPAGPVTVHPTGQFPGDALTAWRGPDKYKLGQPRKPNDTPAHKVPGWVVSNVGLGFEQPSTYKGRGTARMIFQMGWAPNFLRLAQYTHDPTFVTYARNAVVGRWANYPGYYLTGWTDVMQNPRYPYDGPDVTDLYYHHIAPHLAWALDYLVAETSLLSAGQISFPFERQYGYAYFDARVYGQAPGRIFSFDNVSLLLKRNLVTLDNPQLNYLPAHSADDFFLILTNQSQKQQSAAVTFNPDTLHYDPTAVTSIQTLSPPNDTHGNRTHPLPPSPGTPPPLSPSPGTPGEGRGEGSAPPLLDKHSLDTSTLPLTDHVARVTVPPRGLVVLRLQGTHLPTPPATTTPALTTAAGTGQVSVPSDRKDISARAAAIRLDPTPTWDAYLWSTATPKQAKSVTFHTSTDGGSTWRQSDDTEYPYELSLPIPSPDTKVTFRLTGLTPDNQPFQTPPATLTLPH